MDTLWMHFLNLRSSRENREGTSYFEKIANSMRCLPKGFNIKKNPNMTSNYLSSSMIAFRTHSEILCPQLAL
jgi:hypothetical protein